MVKRASLKVSSTRDQAGQPVLIIRGEVDMASAPELARELDKVLRQAPSRLIIDLTATTFMDCSGVRPIADARRRLREERCEIVLRRPSPLVRRVLEVVGLDGPCVVEG